MHWCLPSTQHAAGSPLVFQGEHGAGPLSLELVLSQGPVIMRPVSLNFRDERDFSVYHAYAPVSNK